MCGITGWVDWGKDLRTETPTIQSMTNTLAARGPDAQGCWISEHAALGHRRLVVIDPEGGGQPMIRSRGSHSLVLVYNGELYNTQELRSELSARGYSFQGHSDTEVLLTAYIEWGRNCLQRLNGIFAFAVWDELDQSLFMARDRLGVKPLFYAEGPGYLLFGSELKALLANPLVKPEIDREGLAEILVLGPARTPGHGVFKKVKELRPGFCLSYNRNGLSLYRYWSLESHPHQDDFDTTVTKVRELFLDAVQSQLVSDVPVCTFLSGGLDSSAISAVAANALNQTGLQPLRTFSIDYTDNQLYFKPDEFQPDSDAPWARLMADTLSSRHSIVTIDIPQLINALEPSVLARDLPGMADVDSSLLLFCQAIKQDATVALSGECADEIFGGYPWFRSQAVKDSNTFPWSLNLKEKMALFSQGIIDLIKPDSYLNEKYSQTIAETPLNNGESPAEIKVRQMFYLNMNWFMANLLDRKDRMSMAAGLEVRVPFCDHKLVEYVWNIPWKMKFCDQREKGLLRRALKGILPDPVLARRKSPYPKTHNPAYEKETKLRLAELLGDPSSPLRHLVNRSRLQSLLNSENRGSEQPWFGQLMAGPQLFAFLIQLDFWLRHYRVAIV